MAHSRGWLTASQRLACWQNAAGDHYIAPGERYFKSIRAGTIMRFCSRCMAEHDAAQQNKT